MLVEAAGLSKHYTAGTEILAAVNQIDFRIADGEFVAIMGPSGSGKTTLMNLIGLLDSPSSGKLALAGEEASTLSVDRQAALRNRTIGFVFQSYNLLPRSTAIENVELPLVYAGMPMAERRRKAGQSLERVGLAHRRDHWPAQLSGGEQQRVAIARAMVNEPLLVLADEPTGALDSHTGRAVLALFQAFNDSGCAIVMVTHDEGVARHCKRIISMCDGEIQSDSPVATPLDARHIKPETDGRQGAR